MMTTRLQGICNQLANMRDGMRTKDNIDVIEIGEKTFAVTLGNATANRNHTLTMRRNGQALARRALAVETGVGRFAHATRHKDDDVGICGLGNLKAPIRI